MTPPRAKPVVAWAAVSPEGVLMPMFVGETKGDAESLLGSEYVGGWRAARRLGYRVARVEIREIEEGQDDEQA